MSGLGMSETPEPSSDRLDAQDTPATTSLVLKATDGDVLTDVLSTLRLRGRVFCASDLSAPWSLAMPPGSFAHFHLMECGSGWIALNGREESTQMYEGDLVILPHGGGHVISSDPDIPATPLDHALKHGMDDRCILRHGGGGPETRLICGSFEFENAAENPLLALLPSLMHIRGDTAATGEWLKWTMKLLANEARNPTEGFETVITRLTDIIFVQAVRRWIQDQPADQGGWLGALRDRQIGSALRLIHRHPERDWNVSALAGEVGMSRSPFAARFTAMVGEPPLSYVTRWRLHLAASLILVDKATLKQVAEKVGYGSEAAFSKAFKRRFGVAPAAYRDSVAWTHAMASESSRVYHEGPNEVGPLGPARSPRVGRVHR